MPKDDKFDVDGVVTKVLPGSFFEVTLDGVEHIVTCRPSGKIQKNNVRIILGDKVTVSVSAYDHSRGIIVWRYK